MNTDTFGPITTDETFKINLRSKCNSKKVVYLSERKKCKNSYVGKAETKFRMRLNNYRHFIGNKQLYRGPFDNVLIDFSFVL